MSEVLASIAVEFFADTSKLKRGMDTMIGSLLFLLRREYQEYRMRYDWAANRFKLETRKRSMAAVDTHTLTPWPDECIQGTARKPRWWKLRGEGDRLFRMRVSPPEANIIQPVGVTSPDNNGERVVGQDVENYPSLFDRESPDYLGRSKILRPLFLAMSDKTDIAMNGLRFFKGCAFRRLQPIVSLTDYVDALRPDTFVKLRGLLPNGMRGELFPETDDGGFWVKRRTVVLDYMGPGEVAPEVTLTLDSQWTGEVDK